MPSNDVFWFKLDEEEHARFAEVDLIDFNWDDYVKYDAGVEMDLKAKNVTHEINGKMELKEYFEIPARFERLKGDAIALSSGGWRPLAFIPNGAVVLFDKNAFKTIQKHIDNAGNPQEKAIEVVVDFFQNRKITIDPKPILLEGNNRFDKRLPSLEEMREELRHFTEKMQKRLPNLTVKATADKLPQLHMASAVFFDGLDAILRFIDEMYKKYESGHKFDHSLAGFKEVVGMARAEKVQEIHLVFAAILFKAVTGKKNNPTLRLLKFNKPKFIEQGNSFNGALDIYSILLFLSEIRNHGGSVFFVTADKDLIHLWNDMSRFMKISDKPGVLDFNMMYFLPRLEEDEMAELQDLMRG
ncbi:hypothetical protein RDI61_24105 [Pseudomonas plecoglossicida]|uniref:hypothetical protein n=1 Tax=Pseudomonas TaxID=286 RepID=UPI00240F4C1F|nr:MULTISPECIES: hypothetical protein [Pseudomonas putida group]MDQ7967096.1 hypothetical protein [Pseudomonas plecoglossicida]WFG05312.1 hypothetical protein P3X84_12000 [Pseudomonas putida]